MPSFQQTTIIGHIGQPISLRYTTSGQAVASFSVAINQGYMKDGEWQERDPLWYKVTLWGEQAERHADSNNYAFLDKGKLVMVVGEMQEPRIWERKDGTPACDLELRGRVVRLLERRQDGDSEGWKSAPTPQAAPEASEGLDDLPF